MNLTIAAVVIINLIVFKIYVIYRYTGKNIFIHSVGKIKFVVKTIIFVFQCAIRIKDVALVVVIM